MSLSRHIEVFFERLTNPLDRWRLYLLRILAPFLRPLIRSSAHRVCVTASLGFLLATLISLKIPLWQLALGPIIWGIPHLIGDLRYLVVRRGLLKSIGFWLLIALPLLYFTYRPSFVYTLIALSGATLLGYFHGRRQAQNQHRVILRRAGCVLSFVLGAYFFTRAYPLHAHFILLHGHNLITLGIWWKWRDKRAWWELIPLLVLIACSSLILFGWEANEWRVATLESAWQPPNLSLRYFEITLASVFPEAWRPQWVVLYGLLQSAHYLVWVRLIPEEARERETPITFRRSLQRLSEDFGPLIVCLMIIGMIGLAFWAFFDVSAARLNYLKLIGAHASLEIAMIGYLYTAVESAQD